MDLNRKLCIPNINSVRFGKGLVQYFGSVIWNSIPVKIRNVKTLSSFKKKHWKWKPSNCQCELCVDFFGGIGFTNMDNIYFERFNTFLIAISEFLNIYYIDR